MRFTIQTLNAAPRLKGFVLDILSSLVNKQVIRPPFAMLVAASHAQVMHIRFLERHVLVIL